MLLSVQQLDHVMGTMGHDNIQLLHTKERGQHSAAQVSDKGLQYCSFIFA